MFILTKFRNFTSISAFPCGFCRGPRKTTPERAGKSPKPLQLLTFATDWHPCRESRLGKALLAVYGSEEE